MTAETSLSRPIFRAAAARDAGLLWTFLAIAAYERDAEAARQSPLIAAHLAGWLRPGDFGVVAEQDGIAVGAAWARQFSLIEEPTFYAGERVPEISIGVVERVRGQGIGLALLRRVADMAVDLALVGLCLNVRTDNPAMRLYARFGYRHVAGSEVPNRVGGTSVGMIYMLPQAPA
jgi:GNAT superfamily N-acetyltransferase